MLRELNIGMAYVLPDIDSWLYATVSVVYESEGCVEVFTDDLPPRKIGDLLFNVIEEDKEAGLTRYIAKITHAFLTSIPGYTRQGIGPEAVSWKSWPAFLLGPYLMMCDQH